MIPSLARAYVFGPFRLAAKIALVVALLVVAALVYVSFAFDLNAYKPEIEKRASDISGKTITIAGDIDWGLHWLRPEVEVHEITISTRKTVEATIERLAVAVPLRDLIGGGVLKGEKPAALRITADGVTYAGKDIGDITLPVRFDEQAGMTIDPVRVELEDGGEVEARLTYTNAELLADITAQDIDYGFLLPGAKGGDISATAQLTSSGATADALLRGLKGNISVNGGEGRISGDALRLWSADLLTRILTGSRSHTDIACLIIKGDITRGVFVPTQAALDSETALVIAQGKVDMVRQRLDLLLTPRPKDTALVSLATPVRVTGAWDAPRVTPDQKAMLGKVGGLVLGVVAPPAALLGLSKLGDARSPCVKG